MMRASDGTPHLLPGLAFRTALSGDAESLSVLAIQVWLHTYATGGVSATMASYLLREFAPAQFLRWMESPQSALLLAERDGHLLGYARLDGASTCPVPGRAGVELATLYVQAPFLGRGVGAALLAEAEAWAHERPAATLWLTVNAQNARARAFYARQGYVQVGIDYFELRGQRHENLVLAGPGHAQKISPLP